jgi:hypothetical protein
MGTNDDPRAPRAADARSGNRRTCDCEKQVARDQPSRKANGPRTVRAGRALLRFREKVGSRDGNLVLPALLSSSGVTGPRPGYCPDNDRDRSQRLMSNPPQRRRNFHARMQLHLVYIGIQAAPTKVTASEPTGGQPC